MDFQVLVIGGGPGGYVAAIRAAQYGLKTALVEERDLGGTCLNRGCIPTKALLNVSSLYTDMTEKAAGLGIVAEKPELDWEKALAYKNETVSTIVQGVEGLLKGNKVEVLRGHGKLLGEGKVEVKDAEGNVQTVTAEKIILATGSEPMMLPIPGHDLPNVVTSDDLLEGDVPHYKSIGIVGGGVIGCEFANFFQEIGTKVTIVEFLPRILGRMDGELARNLKTNFKRTGVELILDSGASKIEEIDGGLRLFYETKKKDEVTEGHVDVEAVLIAVSRNPVTRDLFADGIEIEMNRKFVKVNERFETSIPNVYAIGDLIGGLQLAHQAEIEAQCVCAIIAGKEPETDPNIVPAVVYTHPEMASIGLTEEEVKEQELDVKIGKYLMAGNSKAMIDQMGRGFVKVIVDAKTDKILGLHLYTNRASDLISEWAAIIANGVTYKELLHGMRPHPSYCEGITEALEAIDEMSIHTMPSRRR